ncbi:hypothetical protein AcV5_006421 [Taiwanofungus camphoratus]|nr:hypothetical protein AcV5_006421 [Antrodia cinnamomea]
MTRPFFSRDRISHFELFDRHAGASPPPLSLSPLPHTSFLLLSPLFPSLVACLTTAYVDAEEALDRMGARFRAGHAVDFQDLISRFTLDSATEFLFGATVHSLRTPLPVSHNAAPPLSSSTPPSSQSISAPDSSYAFLHSGEAAEPPSSQAFSTAFNGAMQVISDRPRLGLIWPLFEMFRNKSDKYMRVVDAFLAPILEEAVRKREEKHWRGKKDDEGAEEEEEDEEGTLLDSLVRYTKDPVVLHDEVLNILLAGRDTTACSLTFAVYFLSTHPHVLRQLRAEVLAKVGTRRRPTYEDIKEMRYLRAVINETLRLYPPVPWNVRYSTRETTLLNPDPSGKPFYVPPNTPISWSALAMHRRTDLWGPDAMEFDPDRFLDERVHKYLTPNPFIFLPFNAGPRICLGQQFAYNEISFFLIKLLQRFSDMELDLAAQPPSSLPPQEWTGSPGRKGVEKFFPKTHLTMYALGGLWVRMTEADEPKVDSASSQGM